MFLLSFAVYVTAYFGLLTAGFFLLTYFEKRDKIIDPMAKRFPFVSFIVPVFNEQEAIRGTVNSLINVEYPKGKFEIIAVDDGSTDNTHNVLKKLKSKIVRVFTKENGGCPAALNFGIKKARGELIARFDADTILSRDSLKKMIGYFDNPKVMAVTSSLNVNNNKGFLQGIQWAEYLFGIVLRKIFDLNDSIHVIPGPLSIYRAEFFRKYGGFDEKNITEDTEIAMRIQNCCYKIKNSISASVYTNVPVTFGSLLKQRIRWYTGFLHNSLNYRHLYDMKRKTNLSTFILPLAVTSVFLAFFSFFVMMYYHIGALKDQIIRISVAGFSIHEWLSNINYKTITELLVNYATSGYIFFVILGILLILLFFSISKHYSGEKRGISIAVVLYFLFYLFFFLLWWSIALFYFITGKEQTWGRRKYKRAEMVA